MTTIKVPKHLRERLSRHAGHAGLTAAALISDLLCCNWVDRSLEVA
jgi:hypothetical protein